MRKILYISPYLGTGGTEKHLLDLITGFSGRYDLLLMAPPGETLNLFQKQNIKYFSFPRLDQDLINGLKRFSENLKKILREHSVDLIHIHGAAELMVLVKRAARKHGDIPILYTCHGFHGELKGWDYWLCARLCNKYADRVIAVAKAEENILLEKGIKSNLITTIRNGVPDPLAVSYEKPKEIEELQNKRIIGVVARLETTKGIYFLLEAFQKVSLKYRDTYLIIVGTGSKEAELKNLTNRLNVQLSTVFTGYRQNVHHYLHYFDIFVIPSLHEAHPLVLMEGMGHGKPIVATTVGGIPEVIIDGVNGILVPPGNATELEKAMGRLLSDSDLQKRLGENARTGYMSEFTVNRMLKETEKVYDALCKM